MWLFADDHESILYYLSHWSPHFTLSHHKHIVYTSLPVQLDIMILGEWSVVRNTEHEAKMYNKFPISGIHTVHKVNTSPPPPRVFDLMCTCSSIEDTTMHQTIYWFPDSLPLSFLKHGSIVMYRADNYNN